MPINVAEALNANCPYCVTTAIADQIVVSVKSVPSDELMARLTAELQKLDAIKQLGGNPADVAAKVAEVQKEIEQELQDSGVLVPTPTPTATASPKPSATATATRSASPSPTASASGSPTATATDTPTATPSPTATPTATDTPTVTATPTP